MVTAIRATINAGSMFPLDIKSIELVNGCKRIRRFSSIIRVSEFTTGSHDGSRVFSLHTKQRIIEQMNAPVGHQATCIVPVPAEVEMKAVRVKGPCLSGS